ncbi:hypothetical protein BO78DRAFT_422008 [Aspergillus sclerotiicarbonarius CBS 121057]|uniref:Uncharacterized protein n=1 Tax=Aspergillus sclerotiicarbonarius (strain CBS 121057 / IBT 28362) TaxID=1448318 RepID=A0A319FAF4_ASPSB|nr:hypothetical protein BO78DRAFT_422008 [Aspergillus sclerotiicarbonarius CBS 121057]
MCLTVAPRLHPRWMRTSRRAMDCPLSTVHCRGLGGRPGQTDSPMLDKSRPAASASVEGIGTTPVVVVAGLSSPSLLGSHVRRGEDRSDERSWSWPVDAVAGQLLSRGS